MPSATLTTHDIGIPAGAVPGEIPPAPLCQKGERNNAGRFVRADHVYEYLMRYDSV